MDRPLLVLGGFSVLLFVLVLMARETRTHSRRVLGQLARGGNDSDLRLVQSKARFSGWPR